MYFILHKIIKRPIWIVSDRAQKAGDNGEALFEYLVKNEKNANVFFTIQKTSPDYKRMKKIGNVLKYGSLKYKLYFLLSEFIISSQADEWVINAFGKRRCYMNDLFKFKYVFLQHGIIKDNLSSWLKKYNKDIKIFVTSAKAEYQSVLDENYMYTEKEVKLTGLPRYDKLKSEPKNKILFMPTWRQNLKGKTNKRNSENAYNPYFKETEYCKFYNKLINDERILKCLREKGYTGSFFVHPSFMNQIRDFKGNDIIKVPNELANYNKEFKEGNFLITDFSSVAFDFAYLKKPVLYTQFDKEEFFKEHIYTEGYFEYERDGLGPVCYDYETTVQEIIKIVENDCKVEKKYLDRIENFYYKFDTNNCKRVYEEILKL